MIGGFFLFSFYADAQPMGEIGFLDTIRKGDGKKDDDDVDCNDIQATQINVIMRRRCRDDAEKQGMDEIDGIRKIA